MVAAGPGSGPRLTRGLHNMANDRVLLVASSAFLLLFLVAGCSHSKHDSSTAPQPAVIYHAVLLDNGQVFFGKLENFGSSFPTLTDVYYIHAETSPDSKESRNVLVKRGKEWHAPDRMQINVNHVVLIEPVAPDSKVSQLIKEYAVK